MFRKAIIKPEEKFVTKPRPLAWVLAPASHKRYSGHELYVDHDSQVWDTRITRLGVVRPVLLGTIDDVWKEAQ